MTQEIREILLDVWTYITKAFAYVSPVWVVFTTVASYILFPHESYVAPVIAIVCALALDIVSKYYSIGVKNGGIRNAIKTKKILSESLWRGTKKKIVSVLVVLILCGLSYRVSMVTSVAVLLSTIAYAVIFLRESQSVIENLIDAGHEDLKWFLFFLRKKEKEISGNEENTVFDEQDINENN